MAAVGIVLIAVGAILRFAVTAEATGIDLDVVGVILMAVGGFGLVLGLVEGKFRTRRTERHVSADGQQVFEESRLSGL